MDWIPKIIALIHERNNISIELQDSIKAYFISETNTEFKLYIVFNIYDYYYITVEQNGQAKLYDGDDTLLKQINVAQQANHLDCHYTHDVVYHERLEYNTKAFSIYCDTTNTCPVIIDFACDNHICIRYRDCTVVCVDSGNGISEVKFSEHPLGKEWVFLQV